MSNFNIIDRRENPSGKSIGNRERFIKRAKEALRKSVKEGFLDRSITSEEGQDVTIPSRDIREPSFKNNPNTGKQDFILPGNEDLIPGDVIPRPKSGQGSGGNGNGASGDGEGEDSFTFSLSRDEYYDILFEDLELPDLIKKSLKKTTSVETHRSGYTNVGSPSQLDLLPTMKNSIGRRIALKKPKKKDIEELESLIAEEESKGNDVTLLLEKLDKMKRKAKVVAFIDPIDLRYRNYEKVPKPKDNAVMFCVMDVSGSMGDKEKDLAKRFYLLLYMFLKKQYKNVEIVYIRHHTVARECTEEEFFYSKETGGTVVSTGFTLMRDIQRERYPVSDWNVYCAQTSDGDSWHSDNETLVEVLKNDILPVVQYFNYIEVDGSNRTYYYSNGSSELWPIYKNLEMSHKNMVMKRVTGPSEVYAAFRQLFSKEKTK